jgi:hypothetical protein
MESGGEGLLLTDSEGGRKGDDGWDMGGVVGMGLEERVK